jgi:hypothetical protein
VEDLKVSITQVGFATLVDCVVMSPSVTSVKFSGLFAFFSFIAFSGYNLLGVAPSLASQMAASFSISSVGFWRASLDDLTAYACVFIFIQP